MPSLRIQLFNRFQLICDNAPVTAINQARMHSLLAYLVLHRGVPQSRQQIAFLFWPDTSEPQAHTNLRQLLHRLRRAWPAFDDFVEVSIRDLLWKSTATFQLDLVAFEQAAGRAGVALRAGQAASARAALADAVALYAGDLLPGCYDDWLLAERERLRQRFLDALAQLIGLCEGQRDYAGAIEHAQHYLRIDPLHETTYRQLMRLYALNGDRASALRTYHQCAASLSRELGVEPAPETQEVFARLLKLEQPPVAVSGAAAHTADRERLIGRQAEWETLQAAWQRALRGHAHFVCIRGEAGIGKSRLAEELRHWAQRQGIAQARARAYAVEGSLAYAPVTEWLRAELFQRARAQLAELWLSEVARLLPEILLERPELPRTAPLAERWQRQRFFEALAHLIVAGGKPLLLVLDDLQWCDEETLEWLAYLLRFEASARLLLVGTVRPEELTGQHPLTTFFSHLQSTGQLAEIELAPLSAAETAALASQVAAQSIDPAAAGHLYRTTEGNPLFIVESIHAESTDDGAQQGLRPSRLPPTIYRVLQQRLAHCALPARDLAGLAATVGRSFTFDLLAQASKQPADEVVRGLDELWQRRIVRVQGNTTYDFSHDLIRQVAYAEIPPARRRVFHQEVAQALETLYAGQLDSVCGQLAAHSEEAGNAEAAIAYYYRAALVARGLHAYGEAIGYLNKRLALLATLPATARHDEAKVETLLLLGSSLTVAKGLAVQEVEAVYEQARSLCQRIENVESRFLVLRGLRLYWGLRCRWQLATELESEMLVLARQLENPGYLRDTLRFTGITLFHRGHVKAAYGYFEQILALPISQQPVTYLLDNEQDSMVGNLLRLSLTLWMLGYPEQAQARMAEALARARRLAGPFGIAVALDFACNLEHFLYRPQAAQALISELASLTARYSYTHFVTVATFYQGWVLAEQGEPEAGIVLLKQALDAFHTTGTWVFIASDYSLLAKAYQRAGQFAQGLALVTETLALVEERGDCYWNAELYRLKGELLLAQGAAEAEVETCYQQALDIARQQDARSLELRATLSLARLWQRQGQDEDARRLLAAIFGWFSEGFDTPDLQAANALLAALQS